MKREVCSYFSGRASMTRAARAVKYLRMVIEKRRAANEFALRRKRNCAVLRSIENGDELFLAQSKTPRGDPGAFAGVLC
jgi:hypothetical protein